VQIEAAKVTCQTDQSRALDALNKAQELTRKGLTSVRESVAALRVSPIDDCSIDEAVEELIEESRVSGIPTEFKIIGESKPVEAKAALALYRIVQEGLTNIRKHARATQIDVELDFSQADKICLMLRDNGVGALNTDEGFGLIGLRERVQLLGGEFQIQTQPNQGFQINVTLPFVGEQGQ